MTRRGGVTPARPAHAVHGARSTGARARLRDDTGTMTILTTGILVVILMVIGVGVAITGVHLERNELQAMADGSALAASQAFDEAQLYAPGASAATTPAVTRDRARRAAADYLQAYPSGSTRLRDARIDRLDVAEDGTVTVVLVARVDPPLVDWFTRRTGTAVTIRASGDARSR